MSVFCKNKKLSSSAASLNQFKLNFILKVRWKNNFLYENLKIICIEKNVVFKVFFIMLKCYKCEKIKSNVIQKNVP